MWVHHYEPARRYQSMEWKHMSLPRTKKFKSVPSASKLISMMFWDFSGTKLNHYQAHRQRVNSAWYCAMHEEMKSIFAVNAENSDKWSCPAS